MVAQTETAPTRSPKRAPRRPAKAAKARSARSRRNGHAAVSRTTDVGELERIIHGLEQRLALLTDPGQIRSAISGATGQMNRAVSSASGHVGDLVADTLTDVADRLRSSANSVTGAARVGTSAIQRIGAEIERRPLMTVAIAVGLGFLAGLAGRRDQTHH